MTISFRSESSEYVAFGTDNPYILTVDLPAGVQYGDMVIMQIALGSPTTTFAILSSAQKWVLIDSQTTASYQTYWYKLRYGGSGSSFQLSITPFVTIDVALIAVQTDNATKICEVQDSSSQEDQDPQAFTFPSVSGTDGGMLMCMASCDSGFSPNPPSGMTDRVGTSRATVSSVSHTKQLSSTGATGVQTPAAYDDPPTAATIVDLISISLHEVDPATEPQIPPYTLQNPCGFSETYQQREKWRTLADGDVWVDRQNTAFKRDFRVDWCKVSSTDKDTIGSAFNKVVTDNGTASFLSPTGASYTVTVHPDLPYLDYTATDSLGTLYWDVTMRLREV